MTTIATAKVSPAWQAEVGSLRRFYTTEEPDPFAELDLGAEVASARPAPPATVTVLHSVLRCVVRVSRPGCDAIDFFVNHRGGRDITFTDPRGRDLGIAGVTGIWGTRPAPIVYKPRPLLPTAFRAELARLIGAEPAASIVAEILAPGFFPERAGPPTPRNRAAERPRASRAATVPGRPSP